MERGCQRSRSKSGNRSGGDHSESGAVEILLPALYSAGRVRGEINVKMGSSMHININLASITIAT